MLIYRGTINIVKVAISTGFQVHVGSATLPPMRLKFGQVEALVVGMHGVTKRKRDALRGRFRHFQRDNFPPGINVGRGPRVAYGVDETFKLVFAFELLAARIPPVAVAPIIEVGWPAFLEMVRLAGGAHLDKRTVAQGQRALALVALDGLEDQRRDDFAPSAPEGAVIVPADSVGDVGAGLPFRRALIIDFASVVGTALSALSAMEGVNMEEVAASIRAIPPGPANVYLEPDAD